MKNEIQAIKAKKVLQNSETSKKTIDTIVFSNGVILAIGTLKELEKAYSFDAFEEIENAIIIPGLVNSHTHSIQTFFRGLAENLQLMDWLQTIILPGEASLTKEEVYASSLLGFIDMVSHGTTFANDMVTTHHTETAIKAALDAGIRVKIVKTLMDIGPDNLIDDTPEAKEETFSLFELIHN